MAALLDPGALNLRKKGSQMPDANHRMARPVGPANIRRTLPYDSLKPQATSGIQALLSLTFKAGETEAQCIEDAQNPRWPDVEPP